MGYAFILSTLLVAATFEDDNASCDIKVSYDKLAVNYIVNGRMSARGKCAVMLKNRQRAVNAL